MKLILLSLFGSAFFTIILLFLPLTDRPSYESAMAVNTFILLFYLYLFPKLKRIHLIEDYVSNISSISLILFIIPLIILNISGLIKGFCPGFDGIIFYFILNLPLLFLLSSVGLIYYKMKIKPIMTSVVYALILLFSLSLNLYKLILTPTVKFYSIFWGFFPGPIYDEDVVPDIHLFNIKLFCILLSAIIWLLVYRRNITNTLFAILLVIPAIGVASGINNSEYSGKKIISSIGAIYHTKHFEIIYPPDQEWSGHIGVIAGLHEFYYGELVKELKIEKDIKIRSYIFRDEDEKKILTGAGRTQIAKPWLKEIYITPVSITDSKLKHEISHILAGSLIDSPLGLYGMFRGLIPNMAVVEGISVALEPETNIMTIHEKASVLMKKGKLPSLKELFNTGKFYSKSSSVSYSVSGSFIKYLIDTYGIDKFKRILQNEDIIEVYEKDISQIEKEYQTFLSDIEIAPQKEYYSSVIYNSKGLIEKECPHEIAGIKKKIISYNKRFISTHAYETGKELLDFCSFDNELVTEIAKALINFRRYDEAEKLLSDNIRNAENAYYQNLMSDMLSDISILNNNIERGIQIAREQLIRIPDSDAKRNFEMKIYLYENGRAEFIKKFYSLERAPLSKAGILSKAITTGDGTAANYLFGRLLFNVLDYENSIKYLTEFFENAIRTEKIPKSLLIESANMLLISSIFVKDYKTADKIIGIMNSLSDNILKEYDYHLRRFNHIRNFYVYIKKEGSDSENPTP
ncbi:MAG: hypothetical protein N3B13_03745 [Deltaproteobacteria bacterium]|nr:hypothetical protein [Deltaproteobacteria bacterium]